MPPLSLDADLACEQVYCSRASALGARGLHDSEGSMSRADSVARVVVGRVGGSDHRPAAQARGCSSGGPPPRLCRSAPCCWTVGRHARGSASALDVYQIICFGRLHRCGSTPPPHACELLRLGVGGLSAQFFFTGRPFLCLLHCWGGVRSIVWVPSPPSLLGAWDMTPRLLGYCRMLCIDSPPTLSHR